MIYLPIAELSVNIYFLLLLGGLVGLASGIFGVGGGFLMTPALIFLGIPAPVAVASGLNQILASSVAAVIPQYQRNQVDLQMGVILLSGGMVGSLIGIWIFNWMQALGQIDLFVRLCYIMFLSSIGFLMMKESLMALRYQQARLKGEKPVHKVTRFGWRGVNHKLPLRMRFRKSNLYISIIPPLFIGFLIGILTAIMGVGGGFILIPAMIYILGMPTRIVVGTSLFQIIFVAAFATLMQAFFNNTVDIVLSLILIIGGVIGAQIGSHYGPKFRGENLRLLFSLLVMLIGIILLISLIIPPDDFYEIHPVVS